MRFDKNNLKPGMLVVTKSKSGDDKNISLVALFKDYDGESKLCLTGSNSYGTLELLNEEDILRVYDLSPYPSSASSFDVDHRELIYDIDNPNIALELEIHKAYRRFCRVVSCGHCDFRDEHNVSCETRYAIDYINKHYNITKKEVSK